MGDPTPVTPRPEDAVAPGLRIVLLGGIGSGKSTVGRMLAARGAVVIDADRVGHEALRSDAFAAVAARWPEVVTASGDEVDRAALARVVFADPAQLAELEAMTHPHIASRIEAAADRAGARPVVVEMPLAVSILGPGWVPVVVWAPRAVRLERVVRRGLDREDVVRRMAAQPTDDGWRAAGAYVVDNETSEEDLAEVVGELWERLAGDTRGGADRAATGPGPVPFAS